MLKSGLPATSNQGKVDIHQYMPQKEVENADESGKLLKYRLGKRCFMVINVMRVDNRKIELGRGNHRRPS